jgi:hypothetical protein
MWGRDSPQMKRTEIRSGDTFGVVLEPDWGSDSFAVVLGGSMGGIPQPLAGRVARCGRGRLDSHLSLAHVAQVTLVRVATPAQRTARDVHKYTERRFAPEEGRDRDQGQHRDQTTSR